MLLGQFGDQRHAARKAYAKFVAQGKGLPSPLLATQHQWLLGDEAFIRQHQSPQAHEQLREVSIAHRRALAPPLAEFQQKYPQRDWAMAHTYGSGAYTMAQIAEFFGVHYMTVSRAVRAFEADQRA